MDALNQTNNFSSRRIYLLSIHMRSMRFLLVIDFLSIFGSIYVILPPFPHRQDKLIMNSISKFSCNKRGYRPLVDRNALAAGHFSNLRALEIKKNLRRLQSENTLCVCRKTNRFLLRNARGSTSRLSICARRGHFSNFRTSTNRKTVLVQIFA